MTGIRPKELGPRVKPEGDSSVWIFCVSKTEIAPLAVASGESLEGDDREGVFDAGEGLDALVYEAADIGVRR